ncbi:MAG: hypothetical protein ABIB71_08175 [Candidatus Woesearchaeota archaeon]
MDPKEFDAKVVRLWQLRNVLEALDNQIGILKAEEQDLILELIGR